MPAAGLRTGGRVGALALVPPLTLLIFLGPLAAGMLGALLPAFGWLPAAGLTQLGLGPGRELLDAPGIGTAVRLSLTTGVGATLIALMAAVGISAALHGTRWAGWMRLALAPLLAVPHAAFAVGILFLVAPSGWIVRLLSPWATGWDRPPDLLLVGDPDGLALLLALAVKETFFLMLMIQAALAQVPAEAHLRLAASLGYGRHTAWIKLVLPQLWPQLRLPVYAVLAYSCSVVDMALVLGPGTPPPLSVMVLRWAQDPDLAQRTVAAAGALLQAGVALGAIALWRAGEGVGWLLLRRWAAAGGRTSGEGVVRACAGLAVVGVAATLLALLLLGLWSVAERWRFPDALPGAFSLAAWERAVPLLGGPLLTTLALALAASGIALLLTLGCLEQEDRSGVPLSRRGMLLLYLPLLVPQVSFLFGAQVWLAGLGLAGGWPAVLWMHLLFVLPYAFLTLGDAWRALDPRYARVALCLGRSPAQVFWRVKLPLLKRPILSTLAVGVAVSVALYLPTLLAGVGRVPTLATEVVALATGGDRRQLGAFAFVQALLPLVILLAALMLGRPRFHRQNRVPARP